MTLTDLIEDHRAACSVEGCLRPWRTHGWCQTHYEYWRRRGTPVYVAPTPEERFWPKVNRGPGCWEWTSSKMRLGYGQFYSNGRQGYAHRFAYELAKGPIPEGLQIDHLCMNKGCVNPAHLEAVTSAENTRRAAALKTQCPQGHPYSGSNVLIVAGSRRCKACVYPRTKAYRERRRREAA